VCAGYKLVFKLYSFTEKIAPSTVNQAHAVQAFDGA
jgi:hypothetical protein